jgi:tRNA(fMet)-specific endonuclease VapC
VERGAVALAALADLDADDVAISAVTAAELLLGVELADETRRPRRRAAVERDLAALPVEPYDLDVARVHAALMRAARRDGRTRQPHDLIIAATAAARNRTVVTLDRRGFEGLPGVSVRSPG